MGSSVTLFFFFSFKHPALIILCFPGGSDSEESACNEGDWVRSLGVEDPLEKEMVTHASILAWKTPWMEKPGRLQSMGLQRVGYN